MDINQGTKVSGKHVQIHFLNVGKGNCTIIEHVSGRISMIDIDNSTIADKENKLTDPINYYKDKKYGNLFRFILTNPDMDHMSGLDELTNNTKIINFWDTNNNKIIKDEDWNSSPYKKEDWDKYQELRKSEKDPKCLNIHRGGVDACCWVEDGITILSPSKNLEKIANDKKEYHHSSYVLLVEYCGLKVLLGGEASQEAWEEIYHDYGDLLKSHIFLAPHHGSSDNIHEEAFSAINPDYVVISLAKDVEYDEYYDSLDTTVLCTNKHGTIDITLMDTGKYVKHLEWD